MNLFRLLYLGTRTKGNRLQPVIPTLRGFESRTALLSKLAVGKNVLHLGAVGLTCCDTEERVARANESLHAHLTRISSSCVGVDYDEPSVNALLEKGVFHNLICADVTTLTRSDIPLDRIDLIVAGDIIEHLANPGKLLEAARQCCDKDTRLVVTTPNALGLGIFLRHLAGRAVEGGDHVCSFNRFTLSNLLHRQGWCIEEMWSCYQPLAKTSRVFHVGAKLLQLQPRLGGTLLALCAPMT